MKIKFFMAVFSVLLISSLSKSQKKMYQDHTVQTYLSERTCWWSEICKKEFQQNFRCRCPKWSYCRSPGKYYNAYCTMTSTGYIWLQSERENRHHGK